MDQKQKKISGPRFNIFDFLIILALLVCVVAIVIRVIFIENTKQEIVLADIYFEVEGVSEVTAAALCVPNQSLYLQGEEVKIGILNSATSSVQKVMAEDGKGGFVEALHPDKKTVEGKARVMGIWTEDGFWINETCLVTVGKSIDIYTEKVCCTITITDIAEKQ